MFSTVIFYGGLTIGLAYVASLLGTTALRISFGVFGMVGGPLLGLILNGVFFPFMNSWVSRCLARNQMILFYIKLLNTLLHSLLLGVIYKNICKIIVQVQRFY